jgi:hypothetical protein
MTNPTTVRKKLNAAVLAYVRRIAIVSSSNQPNGQRSRFLPIRLSFFLFLYFTILEEAMLIIGR